MFCLLPDYPEAGLVLLTFSSVGMTQHRKWLTNMDRVFLPVSETVKPGTPARKFIQVWELGTVIDIRPSGNSFQLGTKAKSNINFVRLIQGSEIEWVRSALAQVDAIGNFSAVVVDTEATEHDRPMEAAGEASAEDNPADQF